MAIRTDRIYLNKNQNKTMKFATKTAKLKNNFLVYIFYIKKINLNTDKPYLPSRKG